MHARIKYAHIQATGDGAIFVMQNAKNHMFYEHSRRDPDVEVIRENGASASAKQNMGIKPL